MEEWDSPSHYYLGFFPFSPWYEGLFKHNNPSRLCHDMLSISVREELGYLIQSKECTCPASPYQEEWDRNRYLSGLGQKDSHRMNQNFGFKAERLKRMERNQEETSGHRYDMDTIRK